MPVRNLVFVLGDQLSEGLSALAGFDPSLDLVLMVEVRAEAVYVSKHRHRAHGLR